MACNLWEGRVQLGASGPLNLWPPFLGGSDYSQTQSMLGASLGSCDVSKSELKWVLTAANTCLRTTGCSLFWLFMGVLLITIGENIWYSACQFLAICYQIKGGGFFYLLWKKRVKKSYLPVGSFSNKKEMLPNHYVPSASIDSNT